MEIADRGIAKAVLTMFAKMAFKGMLCESWVPFGYGAFDSYIRGSIQEAEHVCKKSFSAVLIAVGEHEPLENWQKVVESYLLLPEDSVPNYKSTVCPSLPEGAPADWKKALLQAHAEWYPKAHTPPKSKE